MQGKKKRSACGGAQPNRHIGITLAWGRGEAQSQNWWSSVLCVLSCPFLIEVEFPFLGGV
jgi:hypothetical protein